jgi:putative iron-regulated protein
MERKTRIWLGLGAAVLVSGTVVDRSALADPFTSSRSPASEGASRGSEHRALWPGLDRRAPPERLFTVQAEGGEGGAGEGGGQVLGTITEFRLGSPDPGAFAYDASVQVAAYAAHVHASYAAAHDGAVALQQAIGALLEAPSLDTLVAARGAWVEARPAYLRTEAFQFYSGPVDAPDGPLPRLNAWPIDPGYLKQIVGDHSVSTNFRSLARLNQAEGAGNVTVCFILIFDCIKLSI